jgi:hypothetical protein
MPRFTMFSTGGRYTERELAELNRRYEACMAKVNPRDRDALKEWFAGVHRSRSELFRAGAHARDCAMAGRAIRSIFSWKISPTAPNPRPLLDRRKAQLDRRERDPERSRPNAEPACPPSPACSCQAQFRRRASGSAPASAPSRSRQCV